jgi:hypothetical protein
MRAGGCGCAGAYACAGGGGVMIGGGGGRGTAEAGGAHGAGVAGSGLGGGSGAGSERKYGRRNNSNGDSSKGKPTDDTSTCIVQSEVPNSLLAPQQQVDELLLSLPRGDFHRQEVYFRGKNQWVVNDDDSELSIA